MSQSFVLPVHPTSVAGLTLQDRLLFDASVAIDVMASYVYEAIEGSTNPQAIARLEQQLDDLHAKGEAYEKRLWDVYDLREAIVEAQKPIIPMPCPQTKDEAEAEWRRLLNVCGSLFNRYDSYWKPFRADDYKDKTLEHKAHAALMARNSILRRINALVDAFGLEEWRKLEVPRYSFEN